MLSFLPAEIKATKKAVPWPDGQPTLPTQHGWKVSAAGPQVPTGPAEDGSGFPFLET